MNIYTTRSEDLHHLILGKGVPELQGQHIFRVDGFITIFNTWDDFQYFASKQDKHLVDSLVDYVIADFAVVFGHLLKKSN